FLFGVNVLKFLTTLPSNDGLNVPKHQLAKASTSIGANYEEAQAAESRSDFIHKIGISLKESRESHYWLRVIRALTSGSPKQKALDEFITEAAEFKRIFSSIKLSAQKNRPIKK
ncbi:MAG: four helix bundle protein, partial [Bacteroidota bacterium]